MTGLIVVDESGDLGSNGSRFFSMAALVMFRSRYLKNASKMIPNDEEEHKWSNTEPEKRKALFEVMNQCNFDAVYSVVEKRNPKSKNAVYGNTELPNPTLSNANDDGITKCASPPSGTYRMASANPAPSSISPHLTATGSRPNKSSKVSPSIVIKLKLTSNISPSLAPHPFPATSKITSPSFVVV